MAYLPVDLVPRLCLHPARRQSGQKIPLAPEYSGRLALTGFWHGAQWNFLFWGLYYGLLLLAEKLFLGRLLERLQEQGWLALTEACALTGASVATTRRDFELLQEKGLAQRTHGGLQLPKKEEPKGYLQGTAILNHTDEEKYRIAQEAAA